ncbi:DHHC family palmitoyltransferase [Sporobolomyces salmoneus]|uniref:DHHC family palmitoyltransferase n=1 Tax=Sporobolomyces salmoneus TaxID=183962 RepID=UPI00317511EA
MGGKVLGRFWVGGTVLLISFIGFTSQLFVILPSFPHHKGLRDTELWKLLGPFNVLLFLLYWNYALTVRTNPGNVPSHWEPNWKEMELGQTEVKKLTGTARFCRTCQAYKPPRTHHCRQCKTCILKMDHHCPWVNNCVGHFNQGHFVRFLFYVDLACSYHLWMITRRAFGITAFQRHPTTFQIIILLLNYVACVPVLLIVGVFSLFHFWNVLMNSTTIEGWEKDKVASLKRRGKIRQYRYPYHLGYLENVQAVLGKNVFMWWLPQGMEGDGKSFRVGKGIEPHEQYLWPPRDEFIKPRKNRKALTHPAGSPFTYGSGLNPALVGRRSDQDVPSTQEKAKEGESTLRRRRRRSSRDSTHSSASGGSSSSPSVVLSDYDEELPPRRRSKEEEEDDQDSDEIPLESLARRNRPAPIGPTGDIEDVESETESDEDEEDLDPNRAVRIRRGSEGYEIRARFFSPPDPPPSRPSSEEEWERVSGEEYGDPYADEMVSDGELDEEGNRMRRGTRYKYYVREEDSESDTEDEREIELVNLGE